MSLKMHLGDRTIDVGARPDETWRLQLIDGKLTVLLKGSDFRLDGISAVDATFLSCLEAAPAPALPPPKRLRRAPYVSDDEEDTESAEPASSSFQIRIGDVVLVKLAPSDGLLLVTDLPDGVGAEARLTGLWLYCQDELKGLSKTAVMSAPYAFSTHDDGGSLLCESVQETCRPLDWYHDAAAGAEPRVADFMFDVAQRKFLRGVPRWLVLGWASAASKDVGEVRAAILNQVGPLLGGKYGQIMDELALCGPAGTSRLAVIKREIIARRVPVTTNSPRLAATGVCWACSAQRPLAGAVGSHKVGRQCAEKLRCLSSLVEIFEDFLLRPFDPDTAPDVIEQANAALTPAL